ncbi:MAG: TetR/AcrR family transcriptional regulator [Pseudomonas sp.]
MTKVEEIKCQAVRLMAEKSFDAMSLRQLAEAVHLHPGSIYTHYQSKVQLLRELCCDYQDDLLAMWLERRKRKPQGADEQLQSFITVYVGFYYARRAESRVFHLDMRRLPAGDRAAVDELRARYESELEVILSCGLEAGTFQLTDLRATRLAILALLQGICAAGCDAIALSEGQAFDACAAAIFRLVGARQSPPLRSRIKRSRDGLCSVALTVSSLAG